MNTFQRGSREKPETQTPPVTAGWSSHQPGEERFASCSSNASKFSGPQWRKGGGRGERESKREGERRRGREEERGEERGKEREGVRERERVRREGEGGKKGEGVREVETGGERWRERLGEVCGVKGAGQ